MPTRVLWVDDEADEKLGILQRSIRTRTNVELKIALSLEDALNYIDGPEAKCWDKLVTDVILPYSNYFGARQDVGVEIARSAASKGIKEIFFLTVHRIQTLSEEIGNIRNEYPDVEILHYDKLSLSGERLLSFLRRLDAGD